MKKAKYVTSIVLDPEHLYWINTRPYGFNVSGFVRQKIDEEILKEKQSRLGNLTEGS